jgi:putative transposase
LINIDAEGIIHDFIREQLRAQGCPVRIINGTPDHVHCLFLLTPKKSIADVIKQVKGSSSHFINEQQFIGKKFAWHNGYGAFSVSDSAVEIVFKYIKKNKSNTIVSKHLSMSSKRCLLFMIWRSSLVFDYIF